MARIAETEPTVAETLAQLGRIRALADRDICSLASLQTVEAAHACANAGALVARADAKVADADLSLDEDDLGPAFFCFSINCVVLERNVDERHSGALDRTDQRPRPLKLELNIKIRFEAGRSEAD